MGLLSGKTALITGMLTNRSIAYAIAKVFYSQGARLIFTAQNERALIKVKTLASEFDTTSVYTCDLSDDNQIEKTFTQIKSKLQKDNSNNKLDIIIHSVAFAKKEELKGDFLDIVTREGFALAHDISSYSFCALAKSAKKHDLLNTNASLITLSYLGSQIAVPSYNVMGLAKASLEANVNYMAASLGKDNIRVNGISAGPIKTLAASGINGFNNILEHTKKYSPLKRSIEAIEVGNTALFLASDLASAITGQIIYVDCGYSKVLPLE